MFTVTYTKNSIIIEYDDGCDVYVKEINSNELKKEIEKVGMNGFVKEDTYRMAKTMINSIYGMTKEDRSNGTH